VCDREFFTLWGSSGKKVKKCDRGLIIIILLLFMLSSYYLVHERVQWQAYDLILNTCTHFAAVDEIDSQVMWLSRCCKGI